MKKMNLLQWLSFTTMMFALGLVGLAFIIDSFLLMFMALTTAIAGAILAAANVDNWKE